MDAIPGTPCHLSSHETANELLVRQVARKIVEMTMSTTMSAAASTQGLRKPFWAASPSPTITMKRWWGSYVRRRVEREAASRLWSMSDRELKDIGLSRSQIMGAVNEAARDRIFSRYY